MKIFLAIFLFFYSGCMFFGELHEIKKEKKLIISLSRTACFGNCPVYSIKIFSNGSGIYNGFHFTDTIGEVHFSTTKSQIDSILKKAKEIDFANMQDKYTESITDLSTCYVRIKNKQIEDYYGSPESLKELEKMIDDLYFKSKMR